MIIYSTGIIIALLFIVYMITNNYSQSIPQPRKINNIPKKINYIVQKENNYHDLIVPEIANRGGNTRSLIEGFEETVRGLFITQDDKITMEPIYGTLTYQKHDEHQSKCPDGEDYDAGLCYPKCKEDYSGKGPVCWGNCPSNFKDIGAFCEKPSSYGRGVGYFSQEKCESSDTHGAKENGCEQSGLLWYPKCDNQFHAFGCCVCSPDCPTGWTDTGVGCTKPSYGRGVGKIPSAYDTKKENDAGYPIQEIIPKNNGYSAKVSVPLYDYTLSGYNNIPPECYITQTPDNYCIQERMGETDDMQIAIAQCTLPPQVDESCLYY